MLTVSNALLMSGAIVHFDVVWLKAIVMVLFKLCSEGLVQLLLLKLCYLEYCCDVR